MIGAAIRANRCVVIPVVGIEFEGVNLGKQGDKSEIIIIYAVFAQMNFPQVLQLSSFRSSPSIVTYSQSIPAYPMVIRAILTERDS